ncbi:MAG: hypothetical protein LBD27_05995, partial [Tannerella sp.]|nr:hypothetical protein [Tannerella sp.]
MRYITICALGGLMLASSCNNDFLKEEHPVYSSVESAGITVSPEWEEGDYQVVCNVENTTFKVVSKPHWLAVSTMSGKIENGIAVIRLKANPDKELQSKVGIYNSLMMLETANKQNVAVPVSYLVEGNPVLEWQITPNDNLHVNANTFALLGIYNPSDGILLWALKEKPDWITLTGYDDLKEITENAGHVLFNGPITRILMNTSDGSNVLDNKEGVIILVSNDSKQPEVRIPVTYTHQKPELYIDPNYLTCNFGLSVNNINLSFSNHDVGALKWSFENIPEWLTVAPDNGVLYSYFMETVQLSVNRNKIPAGVFEHVIRLKTNDPDNPTVPITLKIRNTADNGGNIVGIEGVLTDAWYDKQTDLLYYTTAQPNMLVVYDAKAKKVLKRQTLSKQPNCLSMSENGKKIATGHNGLITILNADDLSQIRTLDINIPIFDIEWANNEWLACTESDMNNVQWTRMYWIREDGSGRLSSEQIYQNCVIRKIPNSDYILGAESALSSGVYVFNTTSRIRTQQIHTWMRNFWFMENGTLIVDSYGKIHRKSILLTSGETGYSPVDAVKTNDPFSANTELLWADYCSATKTLWAVSSGYGYYQPADRIYRIETNDYRVTETVSFDNYYAHNNK